MSLDYQETSEHEGLWVSCLEFIKTRVGHQSFETWFKPIIPVKLEDSKLTLHVPNRFHIEWLESHYSKIIKGAMRGAGYEGLAPEYAVTARSEHDEPVKAEQKRLKRPEDDRTRLNDMYTFESFVEGPCNQFARAAARAVADAPGRTSFNPLFIYGGVGLGKTHLAQAIGNCARERDTANKILYVSSERFTLEFINSLGKRKTDAFVRFYRGIDLLIVDDIQFLIKKEQTQEQFFHTFNALYQDKKQIILTSDRPPSDLLGMEERVVSRFQAGLSADLQEPDLETRIAILQKRAEEDGIAIHRDVIEFFAANITGNIRELKGSLIRLLAYASLTGADLDMELARRVLKEVLGSKKGHTTIEDVIGLVGLEFGVDSNTIIGKGRRMEVALARQVAMYLSRVLTNHSLKTVGLHFGGRDHSTVIHACKLVEKRCSGEKDFGERVEGLRKKLEYSSF